MTYQSIGKGIVKRSVRRVMGVFIDGLGLDRASRRLKRKVELSKLLDGVTSGLVPTVARYYTIIPREDDSRQRSFLDAVERAGLQVVVKRLPPKNVERQVGIEIEMAADLVAFALGAETGPAGELSGDLPAPSLNPKTVAPLPKRRKGDAVPSKEGEAQPATESENQSASESPIQRVAVIVCPSQELSYPIALIKALGADTVSADFGEFRSNDVLKSAAKWIDLSGSETIWRD